jgi:alpha-glucosidase (family GH31 glycosyl hydrolase)
VDDSHCLVFDSSGCLAVRGQVVVAVDLYFFGYDLDYQACLRDFCLVAGPAPISPRWILGNWWSRYWEYTQDELTSLMVDFKKHEVPLAVCIIDMDWHLVQVGEGINGWTGYTWNRELFPNPDEFLAWLHNQGVRSALNLHPALGVRSYEEGYPEMARRLGLDPESGETIAFDIASPEFAAAYFEVLHHPEEARGVDFWWIDWQQGELTALPGLDPLWWLNHLHFYDLGRDGKRRPFIFSRWGGLGNHRYPIGFSGDTQVTWASLSFQPYFTATAANVAYGWWSHDIGGHMFGTEDPELYTRWVQFGVFSPIFRLHSTKNPFHERRPWGYDAEVFRITRDAMQLRHALIPYLYTMAWEYTGQARPPIRPMYHDYPEAEEAYSCLQQYTFGSELIAAPFTAPADPDTLLSRQLVWLPPGDWFNFFSGAYQPGDRWQVCYGRLEEIPVFVRAGAIVPLGPKIGWGGLENPSSLIVHIFAGADNEFILYEDDGQSMAYQNGASYQTAFTLEWQEDRLLFGISAGRGDSTLVPEKRRYQLVVHGIHEPESVRLEIDGRNQDCPFSYDGQSDSLVIFEIELPVSSALALLVTGDQSLISRRDRTLAQCREMVSGFRLETMAKAALDKRLPEIMADTAGLAAFSMALTPSQSQCLLEILSEAGAYHVEEAGSQEFWILWNNRQDEGVQYALAEEKEEFWNLSERFVVEKGPLPQFKVLHLSAKSLLTLRYGDYTVKIS